MLDKLKQYGIKNSCLRALKKIGRAIGIKSETYLIYLLNQNDQQVLKPLPEQYQVFEINDVQLLIDSPFNFDDAKIAIFQRRFQTAGYFCYGVIYQEQLVYYCWISCNEFDFPSDLYSPILNSAQGLLLDAMCHANARGSGVHSFMNFYRTSKLFSLGKNQALVILLAENIPAIKSQEKIGFQLAEKITITQGWGLAKVSK